MIHILKSLQFSRNSNNSALHLPTMKKLGSHTEKKVLSNFKKQQTLTGKNGNALHAYLVQAITTRKKRISLRGRGNEVSLLFISGLEITSARVACNTIAQSSLSKTNI
jgi:hypothetical protein